MSRLRRHIIEELLVFHPKGETDPLDLRLQSGLISVYESVLDLGFQKITSFFILLLVIFVDHAEEMAIMKLLMILL